MLKSELEAKVLELEKANQKLKEANQTLSDEVKGLEMLVEAKDITESEKLKDWEVVDGKLREALDTFVKRFNLMNPNGKIRLRLENDIYRSKESTDKGPNGEAVVAKGCLRLILNKENVLGTSTPFMLSNQVVGFTHVNQIETQEWEDRLYVELLNHLIGCAVMVFDAHQKNEKLNSN